LNHADSEVTEHAVLHVMSNGPACQGVTDGFMSVTSLKTLKTAGLVVNRPLNVFLISFYCNEKCPKPMLHSDFLNICGFIKHW